MKAVFNRQTVAEADKSELIYIEGNWYFPESSLNKDFLNKSDTQYNCPWKGDCTYYDVTVDGQTAKDGTFNYATPKDSAIERVRKDFSKHYAFWNGVEVTE